MDFLCEHVVERKKEGLYRFKRGAIMTAWIVLPIIFIIGCMALSSLDGLIFLRFSPFLIPLFVFLGLKLGPITMAYGSVAYEYSISSGEMSFSKIYGDRFRRDWVSFSLAKLEACAPYTAAYNSDAENGNFKYIYKAVSSMDAPYIYFAIFRNEHEEACLIFFEVTKKSLKMIKNYYPRTVLTNITE